jgi:class 3 adenylate cyclase
MRFGSAHLNEGVPMPIGASLATGTPSSRLTSRRPWQWRRLDDSRRFVSKTHLMPPIRRSSLSNPDDTRTFPHGTGSIARVGRLVIGRALLEPGWRWSTDIRPAVRTPSCQIHHLHVLVSGRFAVRMDDGEYAEFGLDDVFDVPAGHDAWVVGDEPVEILDISGNSAEFGLPAAHGRALATVMMTDIVDSTRLAAVLGDTAWRRVLADHNQIVRGLLEQHGGREINTTGDGFLATFDTALGALACAAAVRDAVQEASVEVRVGVHTGEIELLHDDIGGIAVHATARLMALATPSEVLVSAITRAIAEGSGLQFVPRGTHEVKGIPTPMDVYALA